MGVEAFGLEQRVRLLRLPNRMPAAKAPDPPVDEAAEHRPRNSRSGSVEPDQTRAPAQSITNDAGAFGRPPREPTEPKAREAALWARFVQGAADPVRCAGR